MTIVKELNNLSEKVTGKNAKAFTDAQAVKFIADNYEGGGGGEPYVLPIAGAETLGGIKVGSNLSITEEGVLSAVGGNSENVQIIRIEDGDIPLVLKGMKKGIYYFADTDYTYRTNGIRYKLSNDYDSYTSESGIYSLVLTRDVDDTLKNGDCFGFLSAYNTIGNFKIIYLSVNTTATSGLTIVTEISGKILTSSNQDIQGTKTFQSIPEIKNTLTPTTDYQLVNKKYVDEAIAAALNNNN